MTTPRGEIWKPDRDELIRALAATGIPSLGLTEAKEYQRLLDHYGGDFDRELDMAWDSRDPKRGRVTDLGLKKLLSAVNGFPRCFVLNIADHEISNDYQDEEGKSYGFKANVSGRNPLLSSGSGSRVIFYRTKKARTKPKMVFLGHALIDEVFTVGEGDYRALLSNYLEFHTPVSPENFEISGWNRQVSISEISLQTYEALMIAGGGSDVEVTRRDAKSSRELRATPTRNIDKSLPPVDALVDTAGRYGPIPDEFHGTIEAVQLTIPPIEHNDFGVSVGSKRGPRDAGRQILDKWTEERAVFLVINHMKATGWTLTGDRQASGVGYDLDFEKEGRVIHAEVKGIRGSRLEFNLTEKEWARVIGDPHFVVIAVTSVTRDDRFRIEFLTRSRLAQAQRRVQQYRLRFEA